VTVDDIKGRFDYPDASNVEVWKDGGLAYKMGRSLTKTKPEKQPPRKVDIWTAFGREDAKPIEV